MPWRRYDEFLGRCWSRKEDLVVMSYHSLEDRFRSRIWWLKKFSREVEKGFSMENLYSALEPSDTQRALIGWRAEVGKNQWARVRNVRIVAKRTEHMSQNTFRKKSKSGNTSKTGSRKSIFTWIEEKAGRDPEFWWRSYQFQLASPIGLSRYWRLIYIWGNHRAEEIDVRKNRESTTRSRRPSRGCATTLFGRIYAQPACVRSGKACSCARLRIKFKLYPIKIRSYPQVKRKANPYWPEYGVGFHPNSLLRLASHPISNRGSCQFKEEINGVRKRRDRLTSQISRGSCIDGDSNIYGRETEAFWLQVYPFYRVGDSTQLLQKEKSFLKRSVLDSLPKKLSACTRIKIGVQLTSEWSMDAVWITSAIWVNRKQIRNYQGMQEMSNVGRFFRAAD